MNKLEQAWAAELDRRQCTGTVVWWGFELWKFRLADRTWYTPDFVGMLDTGQLVIWETKGWMEEDANVKLKVTSDLYWMFPVYLVKQTKAGLIATEVNPHD